MNRRLALTQKRLLSRYWDEAAPVQLSRPAGTERPVVRFGETRRWNLLVPDANPAAGSDATSLNFGRLHGEWNLRGREIAMALLNPTHPTLRDNGVHLRRRPPSVKTISSYLYGLRTFAAWHNQHLLGESLSNLSDDDLAMFLTSLEASPVNTRTCAIEAVRQLHQLSPVITGGSVAVAPWPGKSTQALTGRRSSAELSTPVIEPAVWWPLLRACWQYIDVFSHDILAASAEWDALNLSREHRSRVNDPDALLERWMASPLATVPTHRLTYGRFRAGEIHWTLLSLLITDGNSPTIFANVRFNPVRARREVIKTAVRNGSLRVSPGGLRTRAQDVKRADGSSGPWISGFDPATIRQQLTALRTACYIFTAALTMMRDSELLSIIKGSLTTFYGSPAVNSRVYKKRRQPEHHRWWIIEPVAQAITLAEKLSSNNYVFASTRSGHNQRFDRTEQIPHFIQRVAELGPDSGLEPTPPDHISPHQFRRTMAVLTAQQPDGEIALGIQLKHATRRALASVTTNGYAAETPAWARDFDHELQDTTAAKLVDLWANRSPHDELPLAGAGAGTFRDGMRAAADEAMATMQIGDERTLRNLLRHKFSTLRWGTINHCLGVTDQALCLQGQPADAVAQGPMPNRCKPGRCRNSVITSEHAPVWIAEEADLRKHLKDQRLAPHTRRQLEAELHDVQQITKEFRRGRDAPHQ